ncbi:TfoX/Sxy family DNA transformation protein [Photobacterium damselae subsp. piscicida]|uniref:TfoX/Sxy family DNA transformation protein n=1 Tax=Photobacterium damselae TaxID=38293 RepID=UPI0005C54D00|nr:TfoX/Sxy family DNA transformation protein [Photobacterium damselae]OLQ83085.1 DNA transformation protein [Photobacterium damselae subsp. piscicida]TFZ58509.1 TfoX/Sxy family DNA transformation protein [Photobacterium damselae subsp. piscicida]TKA01448.1 TfoX/Sxy family DNA transformation protein [Photobacterium damselae subsp. piscicida]BBC41883.1 DNA transformation protein TfoX1 [Photobacterium damselae subsp. piscicida]
MDKPVLKNTLKLFECFGRIKSRSMFGGFGIFAGDTMFALVVNNTLHLRANCHNEGEFKALGLKPYIYYKKGFPVVTKHYAIPDYWWDDTQCLIKQGELSLQAAEKDKESKSKAIPNRIKDLPNLRLTNERMLKKAGIETVEQLFAVGALDAFKALQSSQGDSLNLELLWALEGAISGQHWSVITEQRRHELLSSLN